MAIIKIAARSDELCIVVLIALAVYSICSQIRWSLSPPFFFDDNNDATATVTRTQSLAIEPIGPLLGRSSWVRTQSQSQPHSHSHSENESFEKSKTNKTNNSNQNSNEKKNPLRVLVIATAPRTAKHIVSLWGSLECFSADVDHVALSGPTWSKPILEQFLEEATSRIPRFSSPGEGTKVSEGREKTPQRVTLEGMVTVNDRYDVGLWCDALERMGIGSSSSSTTPIDQIGLLNDSVFALREFTGILSALDEKNASMTSLSYSLEDLEGTGPDHYWLESVWRGFDQRGIRTFVDHSCRPATDPLFCSRRWWGRKGCIVENFERAMARRFPRNKIFGLFQSDVPEELLTRRHAFHTWVRHPPYWNKMVEEEGFPVSKVNWGEMIASIDDERLKPCTSHLDRSWLETLDFSAAESAI